MNKRSQQVDRKAGEIDRISELPDSLLIYILSLLDDMKDAVKTDLLSKRWKNLWTNLDTLVYNCDIENPSNEQAQQFLLFVDYTISRNTCLRIKKFSVTGSRFYELEEAGYPERVPNREAPLIVDKWVDFILAKNVQDVKLGLQGLDYEIPVCFFRNSSFVTLEIDEVGKLYDDNFDDQYTLLVNLVQHYRDGQFFHYKKTFDVSWSMLKSLLLKGLYVKDEFMAEILLGCPVLETMVLDTVRGMRNLNITTPSVNELKVLNFEYDFVDGGGNLRITAPWIEKLEVLGGFDLGICRLDSMPSLNSASITPNGSEIDHYMSEDEYPDLWRNTINCLLQPICGVTELVAGVELLHALSMSKLSDEESLTYNCKSITLQSPICMHEVPGIVSLLESSPYLETLVIKVMPCQCQLCWLRNVDVLQDYTKYVKSVFSSFNDIDYLSEQKGKFVRIKNVKIDCTEKRYPGNDEHKSGTNVCFELNVVAHIIKNSPVLEKLVILSSRSNSRPDFARRYLRLMSSKNKVGDKAARWDLKKRNSSYEFCFSC